MEDDVDYCDRCCDTFDKDTAVETCSNCGAKQCIFCSCTCNNECNSCGERMD